MDRKNCSKYLFCSLDLTIASRIIAFIGIMISALLITVLLNDRYFVKKGNYDLSRKTMLAFGLDWQHIHHQAAHKDPEGRMISILVIFYSVAFLVTNVLLFYATIKCDWRWTIPWMVCEFLGSLSKFGALIYHLSSDPDDLTKTFIIGSSVYIVITIWWWLVVFYTQLSWRSKEIPIVELSVLSSNSKQSKEPEDSIQGNIFFIKNPENLDSPIAYIPNGMYASI